MSRAVFAKILLGALLEVWLIGAATSCSSSQAPTPSDASTAGGATEADGASKLDSEAASPADAGTDDEGGSGGPNPGLDASVGTDAAPDARMFSGDGGSGGSQTQGSDGAIQQGPAEAGT